MEENKNEITLSKEEYEKLVQTQASLAQDKANLVNEIKELRSKNQLTEQEKTDLAKKVDELKNLVSPNDAQEIRSLTEKVVSELMSKKDIEERDNNLKEAEEEFKLEHPEFKEDNDPGGLRFKALKNKVQTFNLGLFKTKTQFKQLFNEARVILTPSKKDDETESEVVNFGGSPKPRVVENITLTPQELKLVNGSYYQGDKEKFLKDKEKRPDYVRSLLEWVR